jgi:hypothetical protein
LKLIARNRIRAVTRRCAAACLLALALASARAAPADALSAEYKLKAVMLFRFTQFVEWPPRAVAKPDAPLVIGIVGDDPFGSYLDDLVQGEKIDNHSVIVRRYRDPAEIGPCQLLFISRSEDGNVERIVGRLAGKSVLTLGDSDDFSRKGGMVRFALERGHIRLRINPKAATAAGLTISSKVLLLATIVTADR